MLRQQGVPFDEIYNELYNDILESTVVVAHNVKFDMCVLEHETQIRGLPPVPQCDLICTMESSTNFCKLPGMYGYKWPTLSELYFALFNKHPNLKLHDAQHDCKILKDCHIRGLAFISGFKTSGTHSNYTSEPEESTEPAELDAADAYELIDVDEPGADTLRREQRSRFLNGTYLEDDTTTSTTPCSSIGSNWCYGCDRRDSSCRCGAPAFAYGYDDDDECPSYFFR